jgi:hypothetical protein
MNTLCKFTHSFLALASHGTSRAISQKNPRLSWVLLGFMLVLTMVVSGCGKQPLSDASSVDLSTVTPPTFTASPTFPPLDTPIPPSPTPSTRRVSNDKYSVVLTALEKKSVSEVSPFQKKNGAYLLAIIETDDPCFRIGENDSCFGSVLSSYDKLLRACGHVKMASGEEFYPDPTLIAVSVEQIICQYFIQDVISGTVTLSFTGYPDLVTSLK